MHRLVYAIICIVVFHGIPNLYAQNRSGTSRPVLSETDDNLPTLLSEKWDQIYQSIRDDNVEAVRQGVHELDALKIEAGYEALEDYSLELLARGREAVTTRSFSEAQEYLSLALLLSPHSPRVLAKALPLVREVKGARAAFNTLFEAIWWIAYYPDILLHFIKSMIYPVLWAFTLALYLVFAFTFVYHMHTLLGRLSRYFPSWLRGYLTPLAGILSIGVPCLFGPVVCLVAWSCVVFILLPSRRWLGFLTGTVLILWGVTIPLRESLSSWLENPGVQSMLAVSSGRFNGAQREALRKLAAERPFDGVVAYTHGQLLRRYGDLEAARSEIERAHSLLGEQPWTEAQLGLIAFMEGHLEEADQHFAAAEELGLESAALYLNYSKVKFELMDTAKSREYSAKAIAKNAALAEILRDKEEVVGVRSGGSISEINLPSWVIVQSAGLTAPGFSARPDRVADQLVRGFTPVTFGVIGIVLMVLFLVLRGKKSKRRRVGSYYQSYRHSRLVLGALRMLPGGSWIIGGQVNKAFLGLSVIGVLIMPLVPWPRESAVLIAALPEYVSVYVLLLTLVALSLCYAAYCTSGEEEN